MRGRRHLLGREGQTVQLLRGIARGGSRLQMADLSVIGEDDDNQPPDRKQVVICQQDVLVLDPAHTQQLGDQHSKRLTPAAIPSVSASR